MTSQPLQTAARPLNRLSDSGAPRGNDRKYSVGSIKTPTHAERLGTGRVMRDTTRSFSKGETIHSNLTYALRAPNGQRIPIPSSDLHNWIEAHYKWGLSKKRTKALYAREALRGMWAGTELGGIPLRCGAWTLLQSDEDFAIIPQMHTLPISRLVFETTGGRITARYPSEKNNPSAVDKFGDSDSTGVHTERNS